MNKKEIIPFSMAMEGIDGSGKKTVSDFIAELLCSEGLETEVISFPQHGELSGSLVDAFLYKGLQLGGESYDKAIREGMLYAIDRMTTLTKINENGKTKVDEYLDGKILIFDRYTSSNYIHRSKTFDHDTLEEYMEVMDTIEYDVMKIPEPNITFVLKVDPEVSMENIEKRGREKDHNETIENLTIAYSKLEELCKTANYVGVDCCKTDDDGKRVMKPTKEIVSYMMPYIKEALENN